MDRVASSLLTRSRIVSTGIPTVKRQAAAIRRLFASGVKAATLGDDYILRPIPGEADKYYLTFSKERMKELKDLSFIDFTKQKRINKDDFLLCVESAKTMFDFMSPTTLEIIALNKKFEAKPSEDILKELKEDPELEDNYLMIVKLP